MSPFHFRRPCACFLLMISHLRQYVQSYSLILRHSVYKTPGQSPCPFLGVFIYVNGYTQGLSYHDKREHVEALHQDSSRL